MSIVAEMEDPAYVRACIGTVEEMLSRCTKSDFVSKCSLEGLLTELKKRLAELEAEAQKGIA